MHMVTDTLYQANSAAHHPHVEDLNMRFIVGTFRVPDPQNISKTITINPLQIPIDYGYFIKWYSDTIVKKGVVNYLKKYHNIGFVDASNSLDPDASRGGASAFSIANQARAMQVRSSKLRIASLRKNFGALIGAKESKEDEVNNPF